MLNLEELENKLDRALAAETEQSLTEWLNQKRMEEYSAILGEGVIAPLGEEYVVSFSKGYVHVGSDSGPVIVELIASADHSKAA